MYDIFPIPMFVNPPVIDEERVSPLFNCEFVSCIDCEYIFSSVLVRYPLPPTPYTVYVPDIARVPVTSEGRLDDDDGVIV